MAASYLTGGGQATQPAANLTVPAKPFAEVLHQGLEGGQPIDQGIDEDNGRLAAPVLVEGYPGLLPMGVMKTVAPVVRLVPLGLGGGDLRCHPVAVVRPVKVVGQT